MTIISSGIYPINPTVTDGTQLAGYINEIVEAINSQQASATRPPLITKGGLWTKTLTGDDIAVMVYDGSVDFEVAKVVSGKLEISGIWTQEADDKTISYYSNNDVASVRAITTSGSKATIIQYDDGATYFKGEGLTSFTNETDQNVMLGRNNETKITLGSENVTVNDKLVLANGIEGGSIVSKKFSQQFSLLTSSTNWTTIPESVVNYVMKRSGSYMVLELIAEATTGLVAGVNQYIRVRWIRNGSTSLGNYATVQIASVNGGLQGRVGISLLPYVAQFASDVNNSYQVQIQNFDAASSCSLAGRISLTEYAEGIVSVETSSLKIKEDLQEVDLSDEEKKDHKKQMLAYEKETKEQSLLKSKKKKK